MQYVILTAKHHDGFSLFHTQQSDFSIEYAPYKKDIVREFVEAMRAEGLRIGLYFSLIDWHHPDYPAFTEADKPYQFGKFRQPTSSSVGTLPRIYVRSGQRIVEQLRKD